MLRRGPRDAHCDKQSWRGPFEPSALARDAALFTALPVSGHSMRPWTPAGAEDASSKVRTTCHTAILRNGMGLHQGSRVSQGDSNYRNYPRSVELAIEVRKNPAKGTATQHLS